MADRCPMCRAGNLEKLPYRLKRTFERYEYVCLVEGESCSQCKEIILGHDALTPAEIAIAQTITHGDERSGKALMFCRRVLGLSRADLAAAFGSTSDVFIDFERGSRRAPESVWLLLMAGIHIQYAALETRLDVMIHPRPLS